MLNFFVKKIFGTQNDRYLKSLRPLVVHVGELESGLQALSDAELQAKTAEFKERLDKGESLDSIQPEAFAVVREASRRVLKMRHFDVQIIGSAVLHAGKIAEMKTGEGKTLVATLPSYLNGLTGRGVHVVTVNDYLARRDADWMGQVHRFLGLSVGVVVQGMDEATRNAAYRCDITYGQNNEFGFDYLRDNMKFESSDMAQNSHHFAIVDEVDSILIDEARTPLIISGPAEDSTERYHETNRLIPQLKEDEDYKIDLESKQPSLTEEGIAHLEKLLDVTNLYDPQHVAVVHHVNQALRAHTVFERDVDYLIENGQVVIIDEFTGRKMPGRRWSDGLHQAVEAKEGLNIMRENQTLASITFQNYFRMYDKLSGMTGTADTEAVEFKKIYNLDVVVIPTNKPMVRDDYSDLVYRTRKEKYDAVVKDIATVHERGQPVLVGTVTIEQSEALSKHLRREGVAHNVLNAKYHEREADFVAQAGRRGAVTIATNMAGRGTDIMLGGNPEFLAHEETGTWERDDPKFQAAVEKYRVQCESEKQEVLDAGGLYILGTERHESRRIDNQLRGRSGRQGDPGASRFYVSLEDDLMKRFGGARLQAIMTRFGMEEGQSLEGNMMSRAIENAQRRVEGYNFDIRKHVLEFDDVMNKQRHIVYKMRQTFLFEEDVRSEILSMTDDLLEESVLSICDDKGKPMDWDLEKVSARFEFLLSAPLEMPDDMELTAQNLFDHLREEARRLYQARVDDIGAEQFEGLERGICLQLIDRIWKQHLLEMDHLKEGIGLRAHGQKNPLHEYQREGFVLFQRMLDNVREDVVRHLYSVRVFTEEEVRAFERAERARREAAERNMAMVHDTASVMADGVAQDGKAARKAEREPPKNPDQERERLKAARKKRRRKK